MPVVDSCPFSTVTINGEDVTVRAGNLIKVKASAGRVARLFRWHVGEDRAACEARITRDLMNEPAAVKTKKQTGSTELAALQPGFITPTGSRGASPTVQRAMLTDGSRCSDMPPPSRAIEEAAGRVFASHQLELERLWPDQPAATVSGQESKGERPSGVPEGVRWWQRAAAEEEIEEAERAKPACKEVRPDASEQSAASNKAKSASSKQGAASNKINVIDLCEPALFGTARVQRTADSPFPSSLPCEWLSDVHLANAHAADARPKGAGMVPVRYNYPRPLSMVQSIFSQRPALRVLHEGDRGSVLIQQFCGDLHWHNLVLFGPEKKAYYWDPLGRALPKRHKICIAST